MAHFKSTPPGPSAGQINLFSLALRPAVGLTPKECAFVRRRRRSGATCAAIAAELGVAVDAVERALFTIRTPNPAPVRRTINGTVEAAAFVDTEARGAEARWQVLDRLFGELLELRERALRSAAIIRGLQAIAVSQGDEIKRLNDALAAAKGH